MRLGLLLGWGLIAVSVTEAAIVAENFSSDPSMQGWKVFGDNSLFQWDSTNLNLRVTWDSSRSNSYFHHPLPTILATNDDFRLAFDLRLGDVATGVSTGSPSTFQIAVGLLNLQNATRTNFYRGAGQHPTFGARSAVEFDYFPESSDGITATVSPVLISSNNQFAPSFIFPLELTVNDWFHIEMNYTATNRRLVTVMTRNGEPFGPVINTSPGGTFVDFRLDTVAVCSFNDGHQIPPAGSIRAHGVIDNLLVVTPESPIGIVSGAFANDVWQVAFASRADWLYTLERTDDLKSWFAVLPSVPGLAGMMALSDSNAPTLKAFYRVRAERP